MKSILVVDDDQDIVSLVQNRLEANNFKVIVASNGQEGIQKVRQHKPDLVIMDIMMPELQGGEAVRILQADSSTSSIPIIFLTAMTSHNPQGDESKGINVDDRFFTAIAKPFKPEKLLFEVKRLIG